MKILICGGHLTPALALIEELQKHKNAEVIFVGRKYSTEGSSSVSVEFKKITELGIKFYTINTGRLQRKLTGRSLTSLLKLPVGSIQSLVLLSKIKPDVIVSFGGYVALPITQSARLLRIKVIIHEQSSVMGLTNRLASPFADKIFLTFKDTSKLKSNQQAEVIGNLTRKAIFQKDAKSKDIKSFLEKADNLIYITGGNQGSHFINLIILENLENLKSYQIIHQVGNLNYRGDFDRAIQQKSKNYLPVKYIENEDIGAVFNRAKIILSRSGANTVWEIAELAKPSILIPLPISASKEQLQNARFLENSGSAVVLNQEAINFEDLKNAIEKIEKNYEDFKKNANKLQKTLPKNAAAKLAAYLLGA